MASFRKIVILGLYALTAVLLYEYFWLPYRCNCAVRSVKARTERALTAANAFQYAATVRSNMAEARKCLKRNAPRVDMFMLAAANADLLGLQEGARDYYREALQVDRRPELYIGLGLSELALGHRAAAIEHFVRARMFTQYMQEDIPPQVRAEVEQRVVAYEERLKKQVSPR